MARLTRAKLAKGFVGLLDQYSPEQLVPMLAREVVEAGLANQIDLVLYDINQELLERRGYIEVQTTSAHNLTDDIRTLLVGAIRRQTGAAEVVLNHSLDEALVGGVVARTPELELNFSLADKLRRLGA